MFSFEEIIANDIACYSFALGITFNLLTVITVGFLYFLFSCLKDVLFIYISSWIKRRRGGK